MWRFWFVALLTVVIDLGSKNYVFAKLVKTPTQGMEIIDNWFAFTLHINQGAVWGVGGGKPILIMVITAIIIPIVIYLAYSSQKRSSSFFPLLGFGMLLGGAVGNFYDRACTDIQLNGYPQSFRGVRDFIDVQIPGVYNWPVFNVADIAIVLGVIIFICWSLFESRQSK